ncbi:MAG: DNA repair protein RadC [Clostridia bacterium]|nr:DNA repair protein RadC [Clostridia bacterium]
MAITKVNLHEGHRSRLKQKLLEQGLDSFAEHEVLELLLYYAIPYKDTNALAHRLLSHYGSLAGVLEADYHDLQEQAGVGANTASLLTFIPQLTRYYFANRWREQKSYSNLSELVPYVKTLFVGRTKECFFVICMNSKNQVNMAKLLSEGTVGEVIVYPSKVVEAALKYKARAVILAHNHPGGNLKATFSDLELTAASIAALKTVNIPVLDHIIVAGDVYMSFMERGLLERMKGASK